MSDGPPDISKFLFPLVTALILAGTAGFISESPIVAAIAGFIGWRMFSGSVKVNARDLKHSTPEPDIEAIQDEIKEKQRSGGAGTEADTTLGSAQIGPALARKLARLRDADQDDDGKKQTSTRKDRSGARAEARLNKALALKERRAAAKKTPSTAGTSTGTIQRQVQPAEDPNVWWLTAFARLDAEMAHGRVDEETYDREYDRIVRRRDAELSALELGIG